MKGWGGSGKDWTSDNRQSTKKETPSYLVPKTTIQKVIEHMPSADFIASDTSNLQVGQKVEHQKFGFGEVIKMEGAHIILLLQLSLKIMVKKRSC